MKRSFAEICSRVTEETGLHVCAGKGESGDALAPPLCATPKCSQGIHTISSLMPHPKMHQPVSEDPSLPFSNPLQRRLPRPVSKKAISDIPGHTPRTSGQKEPQVQTSFPCFMPIFLLNCHLPFPKQYQGKSIDTRLMFHRYQVTERSIMARPKA